MLQQTQVETVIPYYRRWLKRFPTVRALASAPLRDVLAQWEGLGYYSRARNLHKAAQKLVAEFNAALPADVSALRTLPGIGAYTAAAIASIAYGNPVAVLDGNVKRVLTRLFNITADIRMPATEKKLWALAQSLVPAKRAGDYNEALMDLGATVCKPHTPRCDECPLRRRCQAYRLGLQSRLPVVKKKSAAPHYDVTAAILRRNGRVLITQRPPDKLLGGLWEFPGGKCEEGESLQACLKREIREELGLTIVVGDQQLTLRHAFTHFKITLHVFAVAGARGTPRAIEVADFKWVRPAHLSRYPMGKTDRAIAKHLAQQHGRISNR